jgi:hypothetical protein
MALSLAYGVLLCMPVTLILSPVFYLIGADVKHLFGGAGRRVARMWRGPQQRPAE